MSRILSGLMIVCAVAGVVGTTASALDGESMRAAASEKGAETGKVDVNRAGVEELKSLPGIGPALAQRIVDYRQENGPFRSVDDLLAVKGIGPKLLGKIRDRLTAGAAEKSR